jgi:hypothetical protein
MKVSTVGWLENEEYRYDVNGNLILHISYEWSESNSQWVEVRKHEYTYDASGTYSWM